MANRLPREKQIEVLHHLVEGNTLRSTSRLTGVHRTTITNLMVRFGEACQRLMDREFQGLSLDHVEVDEMWTFCQKKQGKLTTEEKLTRHDVGDQYLWTGIDQQTKLIPCHLVGKRSANNARKFMVDLAGRLHRPKPHESDSHAYRLGSFEPICQISTDGLAAYPEAVDLAFGPYAKFGTIQKDYRNTDQPGRYGPPEMVATERKGIFGIREHEERTICTSHVERHNWTIRILMKRFTRLSAGFSKKLDNLKAACSMFFAFYNYVWRTRYSDDSGQSGRLRPTAAMMAGITDRLWSFEDLYDAAMAA